MRWIDAARARLRLLFARRAAEERIEEEIAFHIEMEAERLARDEGVDRAEALRQARIAFGGVQKHKEALRDGRGLQWLAGLSLDLKLGARMLIKYPGLAFVGVVGMSVAVAIGAASFSVIYGVIDATLPLDEGERVVAIQSDNVQTGERSRTQLHDLVAWREALKAVDDLGAYRTVDRNLITQDGRSESARVAEMSASGFRVARVAPLMGRYFHADDERTGAPPVVVIGYDVWQDRFAASADVVGRTLWLGAAAYTIVGVMPQGFAFPINNRIWTPLRLDPSLFERGQAPRVEVFGRLANGATMSDAQRQLTTIGQRLAASYPATHRYVRPRVVQYTRAFIDSPAVAWALHGVQGLVSMLLVVIGTNVAVLVYARTASRAGEIAVRIALGASRGRVVAQLFAEALVLSAVAAAVGLVIARIALQQIDGLLTRLGGEQLPFWMHFGITPGVVAYVAGLAVLGAVVVGVVPAIKATRARVLGNLQELGSGGAALRLGRSWTVMIVAQVAVSVVGIPLATTAIRGIRVTVAPRFAATQFLVGRLFLDEREAQPIDAQRTVARRLAQLGATERGSTEPQRELAVRFMNLRTELVQRLTGEPGVARVVFSSAVVGDEPTKRYEVPFDTSAAAQVAPVNRGFRANGVEPAFFDAFDVPILVGRGFDVGDAASSPAPVIVNQSFVRNYLGGGNPLGRRVRSVVGGRGDERRLPWQTIVGVVPDFPTLTDTTIGIEPRLYWPLQPNDEHALVLNLRVAGSVPSVMTTRLREVTVAVSPSLRLVGVAPLVDSMHEAMAPMRLALTALVLVVGSVLFLSVAGMYALMSLTVIRRRREIGIRAALGAGAGRVIMSVLARAAMQIGIGVVVGIGVLFLIVAGPHGGKLTLREFLDLLAIVGVMGVVGLFAAVGPARRAIRIQPTEALKSE